MSIGDDSGTAFQTLRGRDFPAIRQFTIFLENRVGQLLEVVRRFEGTGIRICALSISDAAECAFVRFLVSDADRGRDILERSGLAMIETDLVGVQLPEGPQPLLRVCTALLPLASDDLLCSRLYESKFGEAPTEASLDGKRGERC